MLENLDQINWAELEHAYGPATDIPDMLRALTSPDKKVRDKVHYDLYGNLYHQGTVYSATSRAVPFLIEMLQYEAVEDKDWILDYLADLSYGRSYHDVHQHLSFYDDKRDDLEFQAMVKDELADVDFVYMAIEKGVPVYTDLLDHDIPKIRYSSAFLLADMSRFIKSDDSLIQKFKTLVHKESSFIGKVSFIYAYGAYEADLEFLNQFLSPGNDEIIQFAAADLIIRCHEQNSSPAVVEQMIYFLNNYQNIEKLYNEIPWLKGSILSRICTAFSYLGERGKDYVEELLPFLAVLDAYSSLEFLGSLLYIIFEDESIDLSKTFGELSTLQQKVLDLLPRYENLWKFANVRDILKPYNLPFTKEKMEKFTSSPDHVLDDYQGW